MILINKPKPPVSNGVDVVFMRYNRDESLVSIAARYAEASGEIENIHDEKAYLIGKSFEEMQFTGWSFVVFVIL